MSTEEEYKELSAKLRYGLELAGTAVDRGNCTARRDIVLWSSRWKSSPDLSN